MLSLDYIGIVINKSTLFNYKMNSFFLGLFKFFLQKNRTAKSSIKMMLKNFTKSSYKKNLRKKNEKMKKKIAGYLIFNFFTI
jgi:hypothetical protein